jgi:hypothetical protein
MEHARLEVQIPPLLKSALDVRLQSNNIKTSNIYRDTAVPSFHMAAGLHINNIEGSDLLTA